MTTRVLIVSEQADERARASSALALSADVDVVQASSAGEASLAVAEHEFDVLVVDVDLFPKGGPSWLYELRGEAEIADRAVPASILLTGRVQDRFLADWAGVDIMIPKPVDGFAVASTVRALTNR